MQGVDLGEQSNVFAGVASRERASRRPAPVADASGGAVLPDEAGGLGPRQPRHLDQELAHDAFVRSTQLSIAKPVQRLGDEVVGRGTLNALHV